MTKLTHKMLAIVIYFQEKKNFISDEIIRSSVRKKGMQSPY